MVHPEGDGPFPGIVIIHEIFGLNGNIKDIARRFANVGYVALAVDLFAGRNRAVCMFRFMGQMLLTPLNNTSVHALKEALTFLAQQPDVDAEKLGAIGFCMGGGFAIAWASPTIGSRPLRRTMARIRALWKLSPASARCWLLSRQRFYDSTRTY